MKIIIITVLVLFLLWTIGSWIAIRNIEEPKYEVLSQKNGYEIRMYDPYIVAETNVKGSYNETLREGFKNIADYIFGNNTKAQKIAMTAPVLNSEEGDVSEKIAMTVPVISEGDSKERKISFVMPSKYTLETLPKPNTDLVTLREVPGRKVAVLKYTWYSSAKRVEAKKKILEAKLNEDGIENVSDFYSALYNPPFSMPFVLRNEILVDIK